MSINKPTIVDAIDLISYSGKRNVPLIMQSEVSECGLACLAMISSFYGYKINLSPLRKKLTLDSNGINLKQLMNVANQLHFSSRALQCSLNEIEQLSLPCILHWNMDHFVVLTRVTKNTIFINDPAFGKRKIHRKEFSDSFTGIALELTPTTSFKKQDVRVVMKITQLWDKITGLKRALISLLALSLILQSAALLLPYYMQWVVDNVLLSNDTSLLIVLAFGFSLLTIIQSGVSAFRSWLVLRFSSSLNLHMGANLFHHLINLPMSYFEKRHIGDVVSRFGSLSAIREMLTTGLVEAVIDGIMASIVLIMLYVYSPLLATITLGFILLSFLVQLAFYYPNRRITEESIVAEAKEDTSFLESIRAIQTIKLFSHETSRQNLWLNRYAEVINTNIRLGKLDIAETTFNSLIFGLESILVIYFGALIVIDGDLTVGMLLAFIAYKEQFTTSITNFIDNILSFKLLGLHLERLSDITLQKTELNNTNYVTPLSTVKGNIRLESICFRYADNSEWVLHNINLEVKSGDYVAIVGASGCGKTTLLKIILGLLKPTSGRIYLDGVDINQLGLNEYRQHFGAVMQNDQLFSGTLSENITLFDPNYDEDKLNECCRLACILDDIAKLPMKYHSLVGDMGSNFSGGQLQRLFLARALYKEPKILCLDESTSNLDEKNELFINDNMKKLTMTRIIIAHRPETIASVNVVYEI
ncbi:peptidase domain-containing ABC transporter [Aliivibrio fischeri]|uniref:ABC transporter n=1 Tax=Aliivibrio fischeri TaxID=668 RepID=A0A510USC8_ALIFS|nr:peptidase domain-containing ABC transporter [Aliivibrio fischeri]MUK51380.1 ATP-binding cassette domain-containing protein [Aliivibrio fischeri]GEK16130.1 ABC transporter [Aliivibrio fischeri]